MPAKPEFEELTLTDDNRVHVSGIAGEDADKSVRIYWHVRRQGVIGTGVTTPQPVRDPAKPWTFADVEDEPQAAWRAGNGAIAVGVQIRAGQRADGGSEVETFTWTQEMELKPPAPAA
jgi:hypothetical protein